MITLKSFCGEHYLSGVELTSSKTKEEFGIDGYTFEESCNVLLIELDGNTIKFVEDPDDGYRSYCKRIEYVEEKPKYTFPPIKVLVSMMEDNYYEKNDCLVFRDVVTSETVLEVGTRNTDDYYPYCHFRYIPENMCINQENEMKGFDV